MTISQIKQNGILTNKWLTLDKVCTSLLFSNDGYSIISPKTTEYFFEENSDLLFVRHLGRNGNILKGGIIDSIVGKYHECYSLSEISVIF